MSQHYETLLSRAYAVGEKGDPQSLSIAIAMLEKELKVVLAMPQSEKLKFRAVLVNFRERLFDHTSDADVATVTAEYDRLLELMSLDTDPLGWTHAMRGRLGLIYKDAQRKRDAAIHRLVLEQLEALAKTLEPLASAPSAVNDRSVPTPGQLTILRSEILIDASTVALGLADGCDARYLSIALAACNTALEPLLPQFAPETWARGCHNLSTAYLQSAKDDFDLLKAIKVAEYVLLVAGPQRFTALWLGAILNFVSAHRQRNPPSLGIKEALSHLEDRRVAASKANFPDTAAKIEILIADIYLRSPGGEVSDNMAKALAASERALGHARKSGEPVLLASAFHVRGFCLQLRPIGRRGENLEAAIASYDEGLAALSTTALGANHARLLHDRGTAYQVRLEGAADKNLEEASRSIEQALAIWEEHDVHDEAARAHMNLGNVARKKYVLGLTGSIADAANYYSRAIELAAQAGDLVLLATARVDRAGALALQTGTTSLLQAQDDLSKALSVIDRYAMPDKFARLSRVRGSIAFKQGDWPSAIAAFDDAFDAFDQTTSMSQHLPELRRTMRELDGVCHLAAFASIRLGDQVGALERLERGRSQELATALQLNNAWLEPSKREAVETIQIQLREIELQLERGAEEVTSLIEEAHRLRWKLAGMVPVPAQQNLSDLLEENPEFVFLVPVITTAGSELIVAGGGRSVKVSPFAGPELSRRLDEILAIWIRGNFALDKSEGEPRLGRRLDLVVDTMDALEADLMRPLRAAIVRSEIAPNTSIVLTLPGKLAILPVGWSGGQLSLHGTMNLRIAPSVRTFLMNKIDRGVQQEATLVAIANPTGDLPFADIEVAFSASLFGAGRATVLNVDISAEAVLTALRTASHWLFATHGHFNPLDPKQSSIRIGQRCELTIEQVLALGSASAPELVVLSACDSAIHDVDQAPDEFFGLMGAFMQLGSRTVVGNLWPVSDLAATILTTKMFENLWISDSDPTMALCEAQRWLRQASGNEIARWIETVSTYRPDFGKHHHLHRLKAFGDEPVFSHPYYWAGMTAYGR